MSAPPIATGPVNPALAELAAIDQWVTWRYVQRRGAEKPTKVPYAAAGRAASSTDPDTWSTFEACRSAAFDDDSADGVGFVLDGSDDLVAFDLDDCVEASGELAPWAQRIAERLGSYTERSPSGRGVRIFVRGSLPVDGRRKGDVECYRAKRFLTVTGIHLGGFPDRIKRRPKAVAAVFGEVFGYVKPATPASVNGEGEWPPLPEPASPELLADYQQRFPDVFAATYPSASEGDYALAASAARRGRPQAEAAALIRATRAIDDDSKGERRDYVWRTVARAFADVEASEADLDTIVKAAASDPGAPFEAEAIDLLAALRARDPAAYERTRARLRKAKVRVSALDEEIASRRPEPIGGSGRALTFPEIEPWPTPVDGGELLGDLVAKVREFVALTDHDAVAVALWIIHAHAHDAAFHSPRLAITSATIRCGKSSLLRTVGRLVPRPLATSNISAAATYRVIASARPTLLIDELDNVDEEKRRELVGIVNSSHCVLDAKIVRTVGDAHEPAEFSTWAPIALAAVGQLPESWRDRSITVRMKRRTLGETVARMRLDHDQGFNQLVRRSARWTTDHLEELRAADPETPSLNDRAADNWRLPLAIADTIGEPWSSKARAAARTLSVETDDSDTRGIALLNDIRKVLGPKTVVHRISTENLLMALCDMVEAPWSTLNRGHPMSAHQLARLLRQFGIRSKTLRVEEGLRKGFERKRFVDAWRRYLPPPLRRHPRKKP